MTLVLLILILAAVALVAEFVTKRPPYLAVLLVVIALIIHEVPLK